MFLAYSGFSQGGSLTLQGGSLYSILGLRPQSKSSQSWTSSWNTSQPLAGEVIEHTAGPHYRKQQCRCSVHSWMQLGIQLSLWAFPTTSILVSFFISTVNLATCLFPLPPLSWCLWLQGPPCDLELLCCRVDFAALTLDFLVILRETKSRQDIDYKHKNWEKELKKKEKKKASSFLVLSVTYIQDHQLSVKHSQ